MLGMLQYCTLSLIQMLYVKVCERGILIIRGTDLELQRELRVHSVHSSHFTDKESEGPEKYSELPNVIQVMRNRARIQTQDLPLQIQQSFF